MSSFAFYSDLHLEFPNQLKVFDFSLLPKADYLLLAGDIVVAAALDKTPNSFSAERLRMLVHAVKRYKRVFYIAGNHEHYHGNFNVTHRILRDYTADTNITIAEDDLFDLGDCNLFAATLWTDYNKNSPFAIAAITRGMNDYKLIEDFDKPTALNAHNATRQKILGLPRNKPLVVMTHHAPSHLCNGNDHALSSIAAAYYSNLEDVFGEHIPIWVSGHTHHCLDKTINNTRLLSNSLGYVGHEPPTGFKMDATFTIGQSNDS